MRFASIFLFFLFFSFTLHAKVEAYNYDFSLKTLADFGPGKTFKNIVKKYGKGVSIKTSENFKIIKFSVEQLHYKFPVFVQFYKSKSVDFYARLPSYFLHNIFHESLIKMFGPQDTYKKHEESASYFWKNSKNKKHYYRAECTITCFPIFYSQVTINDKLPDHVPIIMQMVNQSSWE